METNPARNLLLKNLSSQIIHEWERNLKTSVKFQVRSDEVADSDPILGSTIVDVNLETSLLVIQGSLQGMFDEHDLTDEEAVQLTAMCFQGILGVPIDEATALARKSVGE